MTDLMRTAPGSTTPVDRLERASLSSVTSSASRLLACGAAAGPLFVAGALAQVLTRPGFDLTRHAVSLLSNGSWGWVQIASFLVTGSLAIAGAVGMRRLMRGVPGGRWAPALLGVFGAGLVSAGVFRADPSRGFPPGTPDSASAVASWHGGLHMISGSLSFIALIAACFVLARYFGAPGYRRSAMGSCVAGALCAVGVASGPAPAGSLFLFLGVAIAWLWVSMTEARLIGERPIQLSS
ncbi:MAG TPA: DUF998 domain-containing protein [Dehalococcoidia bacterium]|nr:DUF998 domain-containing protein [Dehalococcoidia bacterium]